MGLRFEILINKDNVSLGSKSLTAEVTQWLLENAGNDTGPHQNWNVHFLPYSELIEFLFDREDIALEFKLRWG